MSITELGGSVEFYGALDCINQLKKSLLQIGKEFTETRDRFLIELPQDILNSNERQIFIENFRKITLNDIFEQEKPLNLIVFGANSSGKSSFIQHFLDIGNILPTGVGPVTARIIKMTYAPPTEARVLIHSSFLAYQNGEEPTTEKNLSEYFAGSEPAWVKLQECLNQYLDRTAHTETNLEQWGRSFVQIQLPSPLLKMNIDVYDTPGFLSGEREQCLIDNLFELVKKIRPALLFLYENPSIEEMDFLSFVAMKRAIGNDDHTPVFFLSTKADVSVIIKNNRKSPNTVTADSFKDLLQRTRNQRYELLRKRDEFANEPLGGLPQNIDECKCFDICSIPQARSQWRQMTQYMNTQTFNRLISFTVDAQADFAFKLMNHILYSLEIFFDWTSENTCHNENYFKNMHEEAIIWGKQFFETFEKNIPEFIKELHKTILRLMKEKKSSIVERTARLGREDTPSDQLLPGNSKRVRDNIDTLVQEEVMKLAVNETMGKTRYYMQNIMADYLEQKTRKNVLLKIAQREILPSISADSLTKKRMGTKLLEVFWNTYTSLSRRIRGLFRLPFTTYYNKTSDELNLDEKVIFEIYDSLDAYSVLSDEARRSQYASKYFDKLSSNIETRSNHISENFQNLLQNRHKAFNKLIEVTYKHITKNLNTHSTMDSVNMRFYDEFARMQCRILAAKHLYEFNNVHPTIMQQKPLGSGGFFDIHSIHWGNENNLVVKKLIRKIPEHPNMAYLDGHYQYMVSLLQLTGVVPVKYFYENKCDNGESELWILLPRYSCSLRDYLIKNIHIVAFSDVLKFSIDIVETLLQLHEKEIVHRDIKASNILLDENNRCYLSDFGTAKRRTMNHTFCGTLPLPPEINLSASNAPSQKFSYEGMAADIYSFGILLWEMYPKKKYERNCTFSSRQVRKALVNIEITTKMAFSQITDLILLCTNENPKSRPSAKFVLERLRKMKSGETVEPIAIDKECIICFENPREMRFKPCGHKIMCKCCYDKSKDAHIASNCCYCKSTIDTADSDPHHDVTFLG